MTEPAGGEDPDKASTADTRAAVEAAARARIDHALKRARQAMLWETLWPRLVPLLCLIGLFIIVSWLGLWPMLPILVRWGVVALFAIAFAGLLVPMLRLPKPDHAAALARVAKASGEPHRPASAFSDRLAQETTDPLTEALWQAHRQRLLSSLKRLRAGRPEPGMNRRDPYAVRFLVPLLLIVSFLMAGPDRLTRLMDAIRLTPAVAEAPPRIDAWVTPPAYTGRPPIFLTGEAQHAADAGGKGPERVPEGSVVTVRMADGKGLAATAKSADGKPLAFDPPKAAARSATPASAAAAGERMPIEQNLTLEADGSVSISRDTRSFMGWDFAVIPDQPPKIAPTRDPQSTQSGALSLAYSLSDDYGVVSAKALLSDADAKVEPGSHALVGPPDLPLNLPRLRMRDGTGETIRDLSVHPWAGAKVKMVLTATDEAGQTGTSAPIEFTLPAKRFNNPLARAIVEQRRILALDAMKAPNVAMALDALTLDPSKFTNDGVYLSLHAAYKRLVDARNDAQLTEVVDFLWEIALGIEDGNLSLAAQDLRAAQDALRQALERGANDKELDKAMQDLRNAMDKYLEAMAREAQKNQQANRQQPNDPNAQVLSQQDLQKMLDQIENLAKSGSRDAAKQMLSELQQMMENLQAGQQQQGQPGENSQANQSLDKLGDLIRRQQQLMDKTFQLSPDTDGSGAEEKPMTPEERQQALDALRKGQQELQSALEDLQKQMQKDGMPSDGKLGQAGKSMGEASKQLGQGAPNQAVGPQGQALQALRDGARSLAEQMARENRTGTRQGGNAPGRDPAGRQQGRGTDVGSSVKVPDAIDTQRARELLDIIRRKLGETARPLIERDYLERLLQQY